MSKKKATAISLPLSRTAKIMTSAVGVESVNQDIVALATKATEIFLMDFARRAYDQSTSDEEVRSNVLEYDDIHKLVHSDSRYDFLEDSIPKKIKFSDALILVEEANKRRLELEEEARKRKIEGEEIKKQREKEKQLKLEREKEKEMEKEKELEEQREIEKEEQNDREKEKQEDKEEKSEDNDDLEQQ